MSNQPEKRADGLTVLVRCRNHRAFLPRALRSALDTLDCLEEEELLGEILVLDDLSLDGSQKLLRSIQTRYNDSRIGTRCLVERLGRAGLRDLGLHEATFRYVCVMDADDELQPDNVPLLLRSLLDTGAAMVYGNLISKEDGEVTGVRSNMAAVPGLTKARYVDAFSLLDSEKLSSQNPVEEAGSQVSEGWDTALRLLAEEESVVFVPVVLGYYHKHSMSAASLRPPNEEAMTTPRRARVRPGTRGRSGNGADGLTTRTWVSWTDDGPRSYGGSVKTYSSRSNLSSDAARSYLAPLREYKTTARGLFPALERRALDGCSISPSDALFLGYFLEYGPTQTLALELGADMGASTLCFASHPKVARVVNVNPNPSVAEELAARSGPQTADEAYGSPEDLEVLDVARAVVGEYPEKREKISFFEGEEVAEAIVDAQPPGSDLPEADGLVVLIEGLHTRELVSRSLIAVFDRKPHAVVLLDCRLREGCPSFQAGVADFMEQADDGYRFLMVGDLGPALASCKLGVLYSVPAAAGTEKILADVAREFSSKLDPLRLLVREEELMNTVSRINHQFFRIAEENGRLERQADRLQRRIPRLETRIEEQKSRNAALLAQYSRMRYRAANTVVEGLLKLPGTKNLLTKTVSALRQRR